MNGGLPALLTVEEAARVLRIGRTKAYAMAQEWRDTGGKSGLPVVDLGHVLRVPLHKLEAIVGGPIVADHEASTATAKAKKPRRTGESHGAASAESPTRPTANNASPPSPKPHRHTNRQPHNQLDLFNPNTPTS